MDRMFSVSSIHHQWDKMQCRLVSMASLKLAIKLFEPRTLNMDDMIRLGTSEEVSISARDMIEMEYNMLWKFSWKISPPTT